MVPGNPCFVRLLRDEILGYIQYERRKQHMKYILLLTIAVIFIPAKAQVRSPGIAINFTCMASGTLTSTQQLSRFDSWFTGDP
jgi:hypothetical protein